MHVFETTAARLIPAVLVCVWGALFAACTPEDGEDPYALWRDFEHPGGAFHFHCLVPPWEELDSFSETVPILGIHPTDDADALDGGVPGATVQLFARLDADTTAAALASARRDAWLDNGYEVDEPMAFENRARDLGWSLTASRQALRVFEVVFDGPGGAVLLSLWGEAELCGDDFLLLARSFEPRPSGSHE